jgi:4-amino-4-deoxy-L-arabinose transferase-like glycosyltransferase
MFRSPSLPFAVVLVVWFSARVLFFNGYYTEDAPGYVGDAVAIALGEFQARNHVNGLNLGTYAPVSVPLLLFGKTDLALSLWPLACSLLGVLSMAGVATQLFGRGFGVIAALLYATYPGDVFFSTVVMPDAIQSGWLSFSLFLVVWGCTRARSSGHFALAAAGVAMGVCHIVRANGALLVPIGLFALVACSWQMGRLTVRELVERSLAFLAGWAVVFLVEGLAYLLAVGDFLFRFHIVDRHYGTAGSIAQWGLNTNPLTIPYSTLAPLTWYRFGGWLHFNPDQAYHGLLFLLAVVALLAGSVTIASARTDRRSLALTGFMVAMFWLLWPLLYHQFGSQSLTQFIPIHRLSRHLVVYAPGAMLAIVAGCALVWGALRTQNARRLACVAAVPLLLLHLSLNVRAERVAYDGYHRIKDVYARIRDHLPVQTQTIIADPGDLGFFDFWLNPLGESRVQLDAFAKYTDCGELRRGVVLTESNPGWENLGAVAIQETVARLPCLIAPPPEWRLLYGGHREKVYVLPEGP